MPETLIKENLEYYLENHTDCSDPTRVANDTWDDLASHLDEGERLTELGWLAYVDSFSTFPKPKDVIRKIWRIIKDIIDSLP